VLVAREKEKGGWEKRAARFKGGMMGETKEEGAGGEDGTRWPIGWGPTTGVWPRLGASGCTRRRPACGTVMLLPETREGRGH
jgi:hypothetical protein